MEENLDKKIEIKEGISLFYKKNKLKIFIILSIIILTILVLVFLEIYKKKENNLVSEKYIQAGLLLSANENEKSKKLLEDIILSKNEFYSVLALNTILEKNLEKDENKVLNYFEVVGNLSLRQEQRDLVILKKALFLIKISKTDEGKKLLKKLMEGESKFKSLSEEILNN